jgi:hypothetical protein
VGTDLDLGQICMSPYQHAGPVHFQVSGGTPGGPPVAAATLRFRTAVDAICDQDEAKRARAVYMRYAMTGATGEAKIALVPGIATETQKYEVLVLPPPGGRFASRCIPELAVSAGAQAGEPWGPELVLLPKVEITGYVTRDDKTGAASVIVRAEPRAPATTADGGCAPIISSASAVTGADGNYALYLDPGTYLFSFEPPLGAPFPRLEEEVTVDADGQHNARLPPAAVIDAIVRAPDGAPAADTAVEVFEVLCPDATTECNASMAYSVLRGRGRSDADGKVRVVVPGAR